VRQKLVHGALEKKIGGGVEGEYPKGGRPGLFAKKEGPGVTRLVATVRKGEAKNGPGEEKIKRIRVDRAKNIREKRSKRRAGKGKDKGGPLFAAPFGGREERDRQIGRAARIGGKTKDVRGKENEGNSNS